MHRQLFALAFPLALLASACTYGVEPHPIGGGGGSAGAAPTSVPLSTIDTDATIAQVSFGTGAGVFVEYASGGTWRVFTSCDTKTSRYSCQFDIIVDASDGVQDFAPEGLESSDGDWVDWTDDGAVRLVATTAYGSDGLTFVTEPGATARIDVFLDDAPAPRYIYWVGDGGLHRGAPSNPIDLAPSAD